MGPVGNGPVGDTPGTGASRSLFVSLTEALDLTTPAGRAMAGLLAIFAEFEREILRERTRAGLAHARQNGKQLGRLHATEIGKMHSAGIAKAEIARRLGIGRTSVRRILAYSRETQVNPPVTDARAGSSCAARSTLPHGSF
jgi:DNA invertase Pin-like site-specific DNA recombinase